MMLEVLIVALPCVVMCLHCIDDGLGVAGSADDVLSVFVINEMVSVLTSIDSMQVSNIINCVYNIMEKQK